MNSSFLKEVALNSVFIILVTHHHSPMSNNPYPSSPRSKHIVKHTPSECDIFYKTDINTGLRRPVICFFLGFMMAH